MQNPEERLRRGIVCGALAGLVVLANDLLWHNLLHVSGSSISAALSVVILGHPMHKLGESLLGWLGHSIVGAILGAIYVLLVNPRPDAKDAPLPLSATILSMTGWLVSLALGTFFRVQSLHMVPWTAAVFWFVGAIGWGASFAWLLRRTEVQAALEHVLPVDDQGTPDGLLEPLQDPAHLSPGEVRRDVLEEFRLLVNQLRNELGSLESPPREQPPHGRLRIRYVRRK